MSGDWRKHTAAFSRRNKQLIFGSSCLVVGVVLLVRMFWAEPSLPSQARTLFQAALAGDAKAVAASIPDRDLKQMGVSREAAQRAIQQCVIPRLTRCHFVRERLSMLGEHDISGTWICEVRMPDGTSHLLGCQVQRSDHGSVVPFIMWLHYAWAEEYFEAHPQAASTTIQSLAEGLTADRDKLVGCGIAKLVDIHNNVRGIDELLAEYDSRFRKDSEKTNGA